MLIQIIAIDAEKQIIHNLEDITGKSLNRNFFQCRFSLLGLTPPDEDFVLFTGKELLKDREGKIFYCEDGDLFLQWKGAAKDVISTFEEMAKRYCKERNYDDLPGNFFQLYDSHAHGEELRIECRKKLKAMGAIEEPARKTTIAKHIPVEKISAKFSPEQLNLLIKNIFDRESRTAPEILIVEDQVFSCKLILSVLSSQYKCHVAKNGREAITLYATHAPDITFLDIELPDTDGHSLAKLFRESDPKSYLVMVTANNHMKDVTLAKQNKVQGFILKPYSKQKILQSIENFKAHK